MTEIFVFGSNEAGWHGRGAALHARLHYGAVYGVGFGRTGNAWAIPTKDAELHSLPLERIEHYVKLFLAYANKHPKLVFKVTAIGTGLAGYKHEDIMPMFASAPSNCQLPDEWRGALRGVAFNPRWLSRDEVSLLDWLSKEDTSAYGECCGKALDRLISLGFAHKASVPDGVDEGYAGVSLTQKGIEVHQQLSNAPKK